MSDAASRSGGSRRDLPPAVVGTVVPQTTPAPPVEHAGRGPSADGSAASAADGGVRRRDARSRRGALVGLAVVVAAACVIVARQPLGAPWWLHADSDGTYAGSALDILAGAHTNYLDHPGLVEQEALAVAFGGISLVHGGPSRAFAFREMVDLNRTRPVFRGFAIAFFVGGAVLAFILLAKLLGDWRWGVAGGLLWLAQPVLADTIQIRPDVLQAALALAIGYLLVRAVERRSALALLAAAATLGFAFMVKLSAFASFVPLVLATVVGYPGEEWWVRLRSDARALFIRHRVAILTASALWVALAVVSNRRAPAIIPLSSAEKDQFEWAALIALDYGVCCFAVRRWRGRRTLRRLFDPLYLLIALAFVLGVVSSECLLVGDGLTAVESVIRTLAGGNVNAGIKPFAGLSFSLFESYPLRGPFLVFLIAGAAALVGVARRSVWPLLWFSGAAVAAVSAAARQPDTLHYWALPYVLSIPPALWLLRRVGGRAGAALAVVVVAFVVLPTFGHSGDDAASAALQERQADATMRLGNRLLKPGEVAVVPPYAPNPDVSWWASVQAGISAAPIYPYRYVDDTFDNGFVLSLVAQQHLRVRYFIGPQAFSVTHVRRLRLALGTYVAAPVPGGRDPGDDVAAVRLLSGPGT